MGKQKINENEQELSISNSHNTKETGTTISMTSSATTTKSGTSNIVVGKKEGDSHLPAAQSVIKVDDTQKQQQQQQQDCNEGGNKIIVEDDDDNNNNNNNAGKKDQDNTRTEKDKNNDKSKKGRAKKGPSKEKNKASTGESDTYTTEENNDKEEECKKIKSKATSIAGGKARASRKVNGKRDNDSSADIADSNSHAKKDHVADDGTKKRKKSKDFCERDVLLGKGKEQNPGNIKYNKYIEQTYHDYQAKSTKNKTKVIDTVILMFSFYKKNS